MANRQEYIWISIGLSLFSNLVYPSLCSLVSRNVPADKQGAAQGSINGVKALTEGFGPLAFGLLMNVFEDTALPGAPYLIGGFITLLAVAVTFRIPSEEEYFHYTEVHREDGEAERKGLLDPESEEEDDEEGEVDEDEEQRNY
uniref:Major facilitator superfamily (MFS) profile domain-containing protein n=1 Tax=Rhizochromulina marina TaxID=1034831 RepID=A0A7S2SCZ5_9STRA